MIIGITGASGFVGGHLVHSLHACGHTVRVLVRPTSSLRNFSGIPVQIHHGEVRDPDSLPPFVTGLDVLIHAAAVTSAPTRAEMVSVNLWGTKNLLDACARFNPDLRRFVFLSSQEAAGINPDGVQALDERRPLKPVTVYGASKARAEALFTRYQLPYTILRPGPVYGPHDKDTRPVFELARMRFKVTATFPSKLSIIYVHNLVSAIMDSMLHPASIGQAYYVADGVNYSWGSLFRRIGKLYGPARLFLPVPRLAIFLVAVCATVYSLVSGKRQILNIDKYRMLTSPNLSVSIQKAHEQFQYQPPFSSEQGFMATVAWLERQSR